MSENYHNRILDWHEEGTHIQQLLRKYNWQYRKKICTKCPLETQRNLNCFKVDNFKNGIQETHCKKMNKARTQKFRKIILGFMKFHPLSN